ncbi:BglII/BstYI family type II restriction endonuclease [Alterisphingorhabdus coralli]|uniref:BglII/BstYI family type II restriction endonuclease n=1 Tax=Alterisphingorhabdus coralli TaxID=3071408 RepID=A0AA97F8J8_9SPHN|nr:BglII/BstYI family type II restriction endonuclease [Parasphingorhabdus sp. SCSIO 66989]WOE75262.1 BglII/BstYI family type II restriction endonuclease [Parasphingorhabdus sp. SCSIO 66989]
MFGRLAEAGFTLYYTNHAEAILRYDFPDLITEIETALLELRLPITEIIGGGGGETKMTQRLRKALANLGWPKHNFIVAKTVDGEPKESTSHEIDHVRRADAGTVAFEIEWNNKDPFFDRDLENFKRLHAEGAISLGGIVTRGPDMQSQMFDKVLNFGHERNLESYEDLIALDLSPTRPQRAQIDRQVDAGKPFAEAWAKKFVSDKYGMATTHWDKLQDRVARGVGNPCPLLLVGLPASIIDMDA